MLGQQVSHFYVIRALGSGGMGVVYEAQDVRLPRSVALKFLNPGVAGDADAVRRFKREARLASSLNHPNICTVLEVDEARGRLFMAMELLRGRNLKSALAEGALPLAQVVDITSQIALALAAAHARGIVHRDISPTNVFLADSGTVKLLDFGLAKAMPTDESGDHTSQLTRPGAIFGTLHYMAPERLSGAAAVDRRSDLFSLGVIVYQMVTGARPFDLQPRDDLVKAIQHEPHVPLGQLRDGVSPLLAAIVNRLLAKQPGDRYQAADELRADLDLLRDAGDTAAVQVSRVDRSRTVVVLPVAGIPPEDRRACALAAGLTADVRARLGAVDSLRVVSPTSSAVVAALPLREIGQRLSADSAIEGTVQVADGRLRATVTVSDTREERVLGAPIRVEREIADVLATQDAVAGDLCAMLMPVLVGRQGGRRTRADADAWHAFKRGQHSWRTCFTGGWRQAIEHYQFAIDRDAGFAAAHVALANAYNFLGFYCLMKPKLAFRVAQQAAERAVAVDATFSAAHTELALAKLGGDWDWEGAEASFRAAIACDASDPAAHVHYSWLLVMLGRDDAAVEEGRRAHSLAPGSRLIAGARAQTLYIGGFYDDAIAICDECLRADPDYPFAVHLRGLCYLVKSVAPRALADLERVAGLTDRTPFYLGLLGLCYGQFGMRAQALALIDELRRREGTIYIPPQCYVFIHAGLGHRDQALEYQEQAYADGASPFNYLTPSMRDLYALDPYHKTRLEQMRLSL